MEVERNVENLHESVLGGQNTAIKKCLDECKTQVYHVSFGRKKNKDTYRQ